MAITSSDYQLHVPVSWATHHIWTAGRCQEHAEVPVYSLRLMLSGDAQIQTEGGQWSLEQGDALLMAPCRSRKIGTQEGAEWLTIGLQAFLFGQIDVLQTLAPSQWKLTYCSLLHCWLQQLVERQHQSDDASSLMKRGLATAIVGLCAEVAGQPDFLHAAQKQFPLWLHDVLSAVQQQPQLTAAEMAKLAHFSPAQFRRNFEAQLGVSPRDYLMRHRLEIARQLLHNTSLSVSEIAEQSGVGSPEHFIRLFKRTFGVTPAQWRQLLQSPPA